ncbi:specifically androgen-regulated gene protein [Sphaeramia orbicularis]|uniref:Specifically androgen-regulated gene protein-like n=1 Tax=Sphaeramia orbicularis TaxID=375764 RepID=A0A673BMY1_9TELE|nr:specifically androgen-regulated gene protein-like [Sphaeramia orbicularis]XP_029990374.1 specifically androgen-regulated gene protein-like [Sphaeramia orbicularis]
MPKSDTWPGGTGLDTMTGMDSAGSCDSVVSANSGFSDDSLEHLSAEEKACLMFLEETIESLETEEDSGLSNDEPDQLPSSGSVADKVADLSASMSRSTLNSSPKDAPTEPPKKNINTKLGHSYLVPTPFVVASTSLCSAVPAKSDLPPHSSKQKLTPSGTKACFQQNQKPGVPQAPLEVDVVIPPPTKPRDQSVRPAEGPRGPLSYDALVHLRRSASTKKTPLCPTVDHTIDRHPPAITEETQPNLGNLSRSDRFHSEAFKPKTGPPAVPPKPKRIPANISVKTQNGAGINSDCSFSVRRVTESEVVRQEALQKLGLVKEAEVQRSPPKSHTSSDPVAKKHVKAPFNVNPSRSPSFCHSQVSTEPKTRTLQSSASFHHYSRHDQQAASHPAHMNRLKTAVLEHSATVDSHRNGGSCSEPQHVMTTEKPGKAATTAQPVPPKPSNSVGYTVMVVPGMGADRKEALRKLGLLKESSK